MSDSRSLFDADPAVAGAESDRRCHPQGDGARIDALIAKVREAIERFTELRTALVSAAVTGRIGVREEAPA